MLRQPPRAPLLLLPRTHSRRVTEVKAAVVLPLRRVGELPEDVGAEKRLRRPLLVAVAAARRTHPVAAGVGVAAVLLGRPHLMGRQNPLLREAT